MFAERKQSIKSWLHSHDYNVPLFFSPNFEPHVSQRHQAVSQHHRSFMSGRSTLPTKTQYKRVRLQTNSPNTLELLIIRRAFVLFLLCVVCRILLYFLNFRNSEKLSNL